MEMKRGAVAATALIIFSLVIGLMAWGYSASYKGTPIPTGSASITANGNFSTGAIQLGGAGVGPGVAILHSVASIDKMFNTTLILPNPSSVAALNPSLKLAGVRIDSASANNWEVTIYYSNQTFVNGSTNIDALVGNSGLEIAENPAQPGVNTSAIAERELTPPTQTVCQSADGSLHCTTQTQSAANLGEYLVTENGLPVLVNPAGHDLLWTDDRALMNVALGYTQDYTGGQILPLAASMTAVSLSAG